MKTSNKITLGDSAMPQGQKRYPRSLAASALAFGLSAVAVFGAQTASAATLHGFCSTTNSCSDNGSNTPTSVNPPLFGFSAGGHSATGDVTIDILVPDNVTLPASYTLSGPLLGVGSVDATLFSSSPWTTGKLADYLGISGSPANPIGGYLGAAQVFQPSADGFFVFTADLGTVTLPSNSGASNSDLLTTNIGLFAGTYIVAFMADGSATANSGAILETSPPTITKTGGGVPEPATWAMMIVGFFGVGGLLRRRSQPQVA